MIEALSLGVGVVVLIIAMALLFHALEIRSHPQSPPGLLVAPGIMFLIGAALIAWPFIGG